MKTRRGLVALVGVTLLSVFVPNAVGAQPSPGTTLVETDKVRVVSDGEWVRHEFKEAMPGSNVVEWKGARIRAADGKVGCGYSGSQAGAQDELAPGTVHLEREVASSLSRCIMRLEVATMDAAAAEQFSGAATDDGRMTTESVGSTSDGLTTNASTYGIQQKLYYEDPPGIDVNSTTARVRWTYTGTCTTWAKFSAGWGWYSPSGWSRTANWWGTDFSCYYGATTSVTGTYQNTWFCDGIPGSNFWDTWTRYNTNYVQGHSDGGWYREWDAQKWGGCTNLLSFHQYVAYWGG